MSSQKIPPCSDIIQTRLPITHLDILVPLNKALTTGHSSNSTPAKSCDNNNKNIIKNFLVIKK